MISAKEENKLIGICDDCQCNLEEKHGELGKHLRKCIDCSHKKKVPKLTLTGLPKNAKGWA